MSRHACQGSVLISLIDYNAESHPPDRTQADLAPVVRAGRIQRFAENRRIRSLLCVSLPAPFFLRGDLCARLPLSVLRGGQVSALKTKIKLRHYPRQREVDSIWKTPIRVGVRSKS